ncbi:MAG: hypothetical protein PHT07_15555 [Paludibacter sp.]|nr:hypothetical protein [Paludibacter sp.]
MENYIKTHEKLETAKSHLDKIRLRGGTGFITSISKNKHVINYSFDDKKRKETYIFYDVVFDVSKAYKMINSGLIIFQIKDTPTYEMKHAAVDKSYSEQMDVDFNRAQGLMIKYKGYDLLIDGSHRLNNAFRHGLKNMKVYYIDNPKTIGKFTKKI